jgi:hypothetical protein
MCSQAIFFVSSELVCGPSIRGNGFILGQMSYCSFGLGVNVDLSGVCVVTG